ncbi:hypothetical protein ACFQS7_30660 [Dankookia sp. GCM10030260]|uniref:hypothetical protein n=1 Tax=Dankookia sp. GCM10030260 TaxID=3273390 RepID=UPI00361B3171
MAIEKLVQHWRGPMPARVAMLIVAGGKQQRHTERGQPVGQRYPHSLIEFDVEHFGIRPTISHRRFDQPKRFTDGSELSAIRIGEPMRRDRLLLVSAFATALLTLLGAVSESLGMDRLLKSDTSKTRTHSLFRQGCMLYDLIPNMPEHRLAPLMQNFPEAVAKAGFFKLAFTA